MSENIKMRFLQAALPILEDGTYTVSAAQKVLKPQEETMPETLQTFLVGCRHFTLSENEVYSVYPPKESSGNYSNSLPHIVFRQRTLPWARTINGSPWLALVCLRDSEMVSQKTLPISQLLNEKSQDVLMPVQNLPALTEENPDDLCMTVDIAVDHFAKIFPLLSEIKLLTHVKRIEPQAMLNKADDIISHDGEFAVIVANRFVPSGESDHEKSSVFLFSVEGCADYLADGSKHGSLSKYKYVRLVSLFRWSMYSKADAFAGFRDTFENLKSGTLSAGGGALERGHVPQKHITRTGEKTFSLYRGPLLPFAPEKKKSKSTNTSDGQIIYDPDRGIFDMSYAAAWQLGRLMTLENKPIAESIYRWRRGLKVKRNIAHTKSIFNKKQAEFGANGAFINFFMENLLEEVTSDGFMV